MNKKRFGNWLYSLPPVWRLLIGKGIFDIPLILLLWGVGAVNGIYIVLILNLAIIVLTMIPEGNAEVSIPWLIKFMVTKKKTPEGKKRR